MRAYTINLIRTYYELAKPERTFANVITAVAGFLFASEWDIDWQLFILFIIGTTLVIASACVLNNYIDRDLDQKMDRTKKRALPSGRVSGRASIVYAVILGGAGFWALSYTNWLTVAILAAAYFSYVAVYGIAKRHTVYSTLIGTIPGGASLVAGYTAVTGTLDEAAAILFVIMLSWQMVHFYAIGIYRLKDYAAAKLPVLPAKAGIGRTKKHMFFYLIVFLFSTSQLKWAGYTGYIYLVAASLIGGFWLYKLIDGWSTKDSNAWARGIFKSSLIVLLVMCLLLALGPVLP